MDPVNIEEADAISNNGDEQEGGNASTCSADNLEKDA